MSTMQEDSLDISVLQFDFDESVLTKSHRRNSHHHRQHRCLLPSSSSSSSSRPRSSSSPLLAAISLHDSITHLPPTIASISAKLKDSNDSCSKTNASDTATPAAPAGTILPVGIKRGPHPRRYLWDGHRLVAVELSDLESVSSAASALATNNNTTNKGNTKSNNKGVFVPLPSLEHAVARWMHSARAAFFPHPDEVTPDYWEWCKWRAAHRIFSSMASVFGTQSLLLAVGVGAKRTLPAAAAINWVLKDGLGRLGRLSVATRFGESFDSDLKRFRFSSSLLYATALSLDFLTPLFPQYFLPLASVANVGKSVGLTTYISTQPAFHRSFAVSENLADISAKSQAQQMAVDTLGLAFAVTLSALCARHSEAARRALPLVAFPFLAGGDLLAISNELRSIHLRTLNKERAEIIAASFVATGKVPTPEQVSGKERLILPPKCSLGVLPLSFGGLEQVLTTGREVERFLENLTTAPSGSQQKYALKVVLSAKSSTALLVTNPIQGNPTTETAPPPPQKQPHDHGHNDDDDLHSNIFINIGSDLQKWVGVGRKNTRGAVHAALRTDASPEDILEIVLRTAKLRSRVVQTSALVETRAAEAEASVEVHDQELKQFVKDLSAAGWQVSPFMLSSAEKKFYCTMS